MLAIHATSQAVATLPQTSSFYPLYVIVNAGSHFAVPSFLFLSALVLFYNYYGRAGTSWVTFYRRRLLSIVVPYLIWSVFYFIVSALVNHAPIASRWPVFWDKLLDGSNYAHLYFIIIIIQFYILFPLLLQLARVGWVRSNLVLTGAVLQTAFYLGNYYYFTMNKIGTFVGSYLLFLFLGMYAGLKLQESSGWLRRGRWGLYLSFLVLGALYVGQMWLLKTDPNWVEKIWRSRINFVTDYSYSAVCCLFLLYVSRAIYESRLGLLRTGLVSLGIASFGVYFIHPFFLLLWRHELHPGGSIAYHAAALAGGLLALTLSWAIAWALQKWKWGGWIIGK